MLLLWNKFYDKYWNFDNSKFVALIEQARKEQLKSQARGAGSFSKELVLFNHVSKKESWQFINKLSIFINSWIDIKWALWILVKQIKNPYLKRIALDIKWNIDHGIAINETMKQYPKVFDGLTSALVEVWEKTGKLGKILNELDTSMLESIELKAKVKGAMIYPMVLLTLTLCMTVFMMVFIVPRVTESFEKTGTSLPKLTQTVVWVSNFLTEDYLILIAILIWIVVAAKFLNKTYFWKVMFATLFINLPIFWYIVKQSNVVYFIKAFTLLLDSWVLLLESLKTSSHVVSNLLYKKELIRIKNEVEIWLTISKALGLNLEYESNVYLNKLFSEEFAYVVSTWEETGTISESLKRIGWSYNSELKRYISNLSSMMEPIIIVIVGFLVGTIVIAILLPFFELGKVAKKI